MRTYESLIDALKDLYLRGYTQFFDLETATLYCGLLDLRLTPEEFTVDEVYRFEGDSDPDDNSVLYAISSSGDIRGTLVDSYGVYAGNMSFDLARKLKGSAERQWRDL